MQRWIAASYLRVGMQACCTLCLVGACGEGSGLLDRAGSSAGGARLGGEILSTVDGVGIRVAEVQALARETGLSPRAALSRLQAQALLMAEAARRGYGNRGEVVHVAEQAAVQALLAGEIESLHVTPAELAEAYESNKARYVKPERRVSSHILANIPPNADAEHEQAAHAFALAAVRDLTLASNPEQVLERYRSQTSPLFRVVVETLPAVANDGSFVASYMHALFSLKAPGPVLEPVRTEYGWHAIVVTSITPASTRTLAEVSSELTKEVETKKRKAALDALLARLAADTPVTHDAKGRDALGKLEL